MDPENLHSSDFDTMNKHNVVAFSTFCAFHRQTIHERLRFDANSFFFDSFTFNLCAQKIKASRNSRIRIRLVCDSGERERMMEKRKKTTATIKAKCAKLNSLAKSFIKEFYDDGE